MTNDWPLLLSHKPLQGIFGKQEVIKVNSITYKLLVEFPLETSTEFLIFPPPINKDNQQSKKERH